MKVDARPDSGDEPERDELRALLRQWQVPGPPPAIEDDLRREFRRRRAPRRRALWLSLAACVALLLTWQLRSVDAPARPTGPPVRPGDAPVPPAVGPAPFAAAAGSTPPPRRPSGARRREREIVVEPGQAELLAQLGRELWDTRQAPPGTTIAQMPDVEVPRYRQEWEAVAGEWPLVQESVPIGER